MPFPSLGDFPDPRFEPVSLESPALAVGFFTTVPRGKPTGFKQLGTKMFFPDSSVGKESTRNAGDSGLIPGLGRSAEEGTGYSLQYSWASLVAQLVKNPPAKQETWVQILGSNPWTRERLPTPVFWLGEFHGLYSPQGCKESDTTEQLSHSCGACVRLIFLVQSLFFSMDACHVFPQYVLALIPFIRVGAVVTRACTVC